VVLFCNQTRSPHISRLFEPLTDTLHARQPKENVQRSPLRLRAN